MIQSALLLLFHHKSLLPNLRGKCFGQDKQTTVYNVGERCTITFVLEHASKLKGHIFLRTMEQVKFLRLVCLMALSDSAFVEGTFLQRCMACILIFFFNCVFYFGQTGMQTKGETQSRFLQLLIVCVHVRKTGCG